MNFGWFRDTSDNKLVAAADSSIPVPAGHDFILKSTIEAVYSDTIWQGGTWDGTTYVPPDNILVPPDTTTDVGMLTQAALLVHEQLIAWRIALEDVAPYYPAQDVATGHDFLSFGHRGVRGVMLSTTWTVENRVKFAEEMATGSADVSYPG